MNESSGSAPIAIPGVGVVLLALWYLLPLCIPAVVLWTWDLEICKVPSQAGCIPSSDLPALAGAYGDLFGVLNPAFTILVLLSALYTIRLQLRAALAAAKPFVSVGYPRPADAQPKFAGSLGSVPQAPGARAVVDQLRTEGGSARCRLTLTLQLYNHTQEVALSLALQARTKWKERGRNNRTSNEGSKEGAMSDDQTLKCPYLLSPRQGAACEVAFTLTGEELNQLLGAQDDTARLKLAPEIELSYDSSTGAKWMTKVTVVLSPNESGAERDLKECRKWLDGEGNSDASVEFDCDIRTTVFRQID